MCLCGCVCVWVCVYVDVLGHVRWASVPKKQVSCWLVLERAKELVRCVSKREKVRVCVCFIDRQKETDRGKERH